MTDLITLLNKEIKRFFRVWKQTLIPPIITITLYLLVFWKFLWEKISIVNWFDYINFIFPGLLMMSVIMASYSNTSSSFFASKMNKSIEELFVSPISEIKIFLWFILAAILRWFIIWILIFIVGSFLAEINIYSYFYTIIFLILSSILFAILWLINWIYAKSFDDISTIPNFVITPLIYLWWVFYPISILSDFWENLSRFNPILYMVNGLRFGFIWYSDINLNFSIIILLIFIIFFGILTIFLLKKWIWIKN